VKDCCIAITLNLRERSSSSLHVNVTWRESWRGENSILTYRIVQPPGSRFGTGTFWQLAGREELFERERGGNPDWHGWNGCASACDQLTEAYGEVGFDNRS
jgi:hypothetical protein